MSIADLPGLKSLFSSIFLGMALLLIFSVMVIHEIGHWAACRFLGVAVKAFHWGVGPAVVRVGSFVVHLFPFDLFIEPADPKMPPRTSFWLAIAGPLANIIAGTVLFVASYWLVPTGQGEAGLRVVAGLHFLMAAVNMVPLPPLDGWRAWNAWAVMSKHERWSLPDTTGKIQNLVLGGVTGLTVYLVLLTLSGY